MRFGSKGGTEAALWEISARQAFVRRRNLDN